jgi:autotransporter-associated beta strand protein
MPGGIASAVTKQGDGWATFAVTNKYFGPTNVQAGVLEIRNDFALGDPGAGTSVSGGGTVALSNNIKVPESFFKIAGDGFDVDGDLLGDGAILNLSGTNRILGDLYVAADSRIGGLNDALMLESSGVLQLDANLVFDTKAPAKIVADREISDPAATGSTVHKVGLGTVVYTGSASNTYTGLTRVSEGTMILDKTFLAGALAVAGDLEIDGTGLVQLDQFEQIWDGSNVTVTDLGVLDTNGQKETIQNLTMREGTVAINGGGFLRVNGDITTQAAATSAVITGNILMLDNGATTTLDVDNGAAVFDLDISAQIDGINDIRKTGGGTARLSGGSANTYTGNTRVAAGTLLLDKSAGTDAVAAGTITVDSGGTLMLGASDQINDAVDLTLNGGIFDANGFSEVLGTLTLTADSYVDFGGGGSVLSFDSLNLGGFTLVLLNWSGSSGGYGTDQMILRNPGAFPPGGPYSGIRFGSVTGTQASTISHPVVGFPGAVEVVPEPSTWVMASLLAAAVIGSGLARRRGVQPLADDSSSMRQASMRRPIESPLMVTWGLLSSKTKSK